MDWKRVQTNKHLFRIVERQTLLKLQYISVLIRSMITKFYQHLLALVFAVNEINKDTHLLPNTTLGCHIYDSYYDARTVYRNILDLLSKADRFVPNFQCGMEKNLIAVIGGIGHDVSMGMADLLSLYKIPQVKHFNKGDYL